MLDMSLPTQRSHIAFRTSVWLCKAIGCATESLATAHRVAVVTQQCANLRSSLVQGLAPELLEMDELVHEYDESL
jgi:hypothetical protein